VSAEPADLTLLAVALDQTAALLGRVDDNGLERATPCADWTVGGLVDHIVRAPVVFTTIMRGEEPDWASAPPRIGHDRVPRFREAADGLVGAWRAASGETPSPLDWQLAELAVHTWDLAAALGEQTAELDPRVAEVGLSFMQANLKPEIRGEAFGPERPAPSDADAYTRIAAFAGRAV
jgi:uncharacterized protein (TIGR03086 family)